MTEFEFTYATDPHRFGDAVRESLTEHPLHVHSPGPIETVRTASYRGHEITVRTTRRSPHVILKGCVATIDYGANQQLQTTVSNDTDYALALLTGMWDRLNNSGRYSL